MNPVLEDRLPVLAAVELQSGNHADFEAGVCIMELVSYIAGEEFSDHPECVSPVLTSFLIRLNDSLPDDLRQKLKPLVPKLIGTRDGNDELRGWMMSDWAIRTALPAWLEIAGVKESAEALRALPPIKDAASYGSSRSLVWKVRDEAWERRKEWRKKLREAVKAELKKRGIEKAVAAAAAVADAVAAAVADAAAAAAAAADADAVAAAVADAAAAAAAVADAVAAAVADAVAAAAAAADAVAVAVAAAAAAADAVAVADAAAVAVAAAAAVRWGVYDAVYKKLKPIYKAKIEETYAPVQEGLLDSALDLIERMIDRKLPSDAFPVLLERRRVVSEYGKRIVAEADGEVLVRLQELQAA